MLELLFILHVQVSLLVRVVKKLKHLRDEVSKIVNVPVHVSIEEVRKPELDARLVAESVAQQLERRIMFRRAMKRAVTTAMRSGALGIKISVSGRLGGSEIARTEWYREGRVPLHTFRADIDYALSGSFYHLWCDWCKSVDI